MMRRLLIIIAMLSCLAATAQEHRSYTCYRTTGKIKVDGKLNEPDW